MKPLRKKDYIWLAFLAMSGAITYVSIQVGMDRAYSGQPALVWLHALLFLMAVALVVVAIIYKSKR